ncbi:uncharacterized protein MELLADRAFT_67104 [Melampsora larici-populina 98AG31]|uniref:Secreted protein n=1 Tax=Melampsora larici-populina (strain 98AG31 / pathotype 3-4-7) TaxID=747676 RepID=F4S1T3_MELLP|nr:uncharacterized protein MELLADRAFT_67104 [Melampsora larici-populina 98AG31]EGG01449.1 hypothetical protein MELLADRAFT_67104 [Melampsora larici-populina 98AG31]
MLVYNFVLCIFLARVSTSLCALLRHNESTGPKAHRGESYSIWRGVNIPLESCSDSNPTSPKIGFDGVFVNSPDFSYYANPITGLTPRKDSPHRNKQHLRDYKNVHSNQTVTKKGTRDIIYNRRLHFYMGYRRRIEAPIQQILDSPTISFQEILAKKQSIKQNEVSQNEQERVAGKRKLLEEQKHKFQEVLDIKTYGNRFKERSKDLKTSCEPSQKIGSEEKDVSRNKIENPPLREVTELVRQKKDPAPHQSPVIEDSRSSETLAGTVNLGGDGRLTQGQEKLQKSKDLSRIYNRMKQEGDMPDVEPLQRKLKNAEVKNNGQDVLGNPKVDDIIPGPKETIVKSTRENTIDTSKDDLSIQKEAIPATSNSNDKLVQERKIRYGQDVSRNSINQNPLLTNKVRPPQSQFERDEERSKNLTRKPPIWRKKTMRTKVHEGYLDSFGKEITRTPTKITTGEGRETKNIEVALREGSPPPGSSEEDVNLKQPKTLQEKKQAVESSGADFKKTGKKLISQEDTKINEMREEASTSPPSVSIINPMGSDIGDIDEASSDSSSEDLNSFKDKDTFQDISAQDQAQGVDEFDQKGSRIIHPSKRKGFMENKVIRKPKKRNNISKRKSKARYHKQDESQITVKDQIGNLEEHDGFPKALVSQDYVKDISKLDRNIVLKEVIKLQDPTPLLTIKVSSLQFDYLQRMNFGSANWKSPSTNLPVQLDNPLEAYRRVESVQRQFSAMKFTQFWKEKGETLSLNNRRMGKILKFDEPFPDFQNAKVNELDELHILIDESSEEEWKIMKEISSFQYHRRYATLYMMGHDDTYKESSVLRKALARDWIKEGYIIPVLGTIDDILELSHGKWGYFGREQIQKKVYGMLELMGGIVNLQDGMRIKVFRHDWNDEPTRCLLTMKDDDTSKLFAIRLKYLAELADQMNIEFPETYKIEQNHTKQISIGEALIAQHVGLDVELLRRFKTWSNFKESKEKMKARIIGIWEDVPEEFLTKGHIFKAYFEHRFEKVRGLETWIRGTDRVVVWKSNLPK